MAKRRRQPVWVDRLVVDAVHLDQLREHGGLPGVRDENALESALARPKNRWRYEPDVDLAALAAAYGRGLSSNHPFRDGNKRIAFLTMAIFLELNGRVLEVAEESVVQVMVALAGGRCDEGDLAAWIRANLVKKR